MGHGTEGRRYLVPVALVLERGDQVQLVYKHAISTLQPAHPLTLGDDEAEAKDEA